MTVSSGSVTATKGNAINCIGTSELTVTGGTISTVSGYVGVNNSSSGNVVVEGGTISTGSISRATAAIKNTSTGTIRIYGGIVTTEKSYSEDQQLLQQEVDKCMHIQREIIQFHIYQKHIKQQEQE